MQRRSQNEVPKLRSGQANFIPRCANPAWAIHSPSQNLFTPNPFPFNTPLS